MKARFTALFILALLPFGYDVEGAVKLYFFKAYGNDFKKSSTTVFSGGDPIYGLVNVPLIATGENPVTSVEQFTDASGAVRITLSFPDAGKEISWRMTLGSGRINNNRFLFCLMPESKDKLDKDYLAVLKVFNQLAGRKFTLQVRVGEKEVTAFAEENISIDLTGGPGTYGDWYTQFASSLMKQPNVFYQICTKDQLYVDFRYHDEIQVRKFSADSIRFEAGGTVYDAVRPDGFTFLNSKNKIAPFYAYRTDDNSFLIRQPGYPGFSYYSMDKGLLREADPARRCATDALSQLEAERKRFDQLEEEKRLAEQSVADKQNRTNLTKYVHDLAPKRKDPALEKQIIQWWATYNPDHRVTKIVITIPDFSITRDQYNQVLRRSIPAVVVYTDKSGGCGMQWNAYGYEHLGGGAFANELSVWRSGYKEVGNSQINAAGMTVYAGSKYELDCNGLK